MDKQVIKFLKKCKIQFNVEDQLDGQLIPREILLSKDVYNEVKEDVKHAFFDGFQQNPYDLYNNKHSQRQFFSVANTTVPNNQESFAQFVS